MGFNPYGKIADIAELVGDKKTAEAARVGERTQHQVQNTSGRATKVVGAGSRAVAHTLSTSTGGFNAHPTRGAIAGRNSRSLPGIRTSQGVTGQGLPFKAQYDNQGRLIRPFFVGAIGSPSIRVKATDDGGVITTLERKSIYTPFISEANWKRLQRVWDRIQRTAERLSRGRLTLKKLAEMNHPYGKGDYAKWALKLYHNDKKMLKKFKRKGLGRLTRMKGVSNLAVVNKQTGDFAGSWYNELRRSDSGVLGILGNSSDHAEHLLGTKRMRAHGPFLTAVQRHLAEFDALWRTVTRQAYETAIKVAEAAAGRQARGAT